MFQLFSLFDMPGIFERITTSFVKQQNIKHKHINKQQTIYNILDESRNILQKQKFLQQISHLKRLLPKERIISFYDDSTTNADESEQPLIKYQFELPKERPIHGHLYFIDDNPDSSSSYYYIYEEEQESDEEKNQEKKL